MTLRGSVTCPPAINYSLVHCGVPFPIEVVLHNSGDEPLRDLHVHVVLPGYGKSDTMVIPLLPAEGRLVVPSVGQLHFEAQGLQSLRNLPVPQAVPLEVWVNREQIPVDPPIGVLPAAAWYGLGHEEVLAAFVMRPASNPAALARARAGRPPEVDQDGMEGEGAHGAFPPEESTLP